MAEKIIIMGAAGRDFHNFITCFKDSPRYRVIGFTAAQIPSIAGRLFPPELAGSLYPEGIPIFAEEQLPEFIKQHEADNVVFSYSDVPYDEVMHKAAIVMAAGAGFTFVGNKQTMLPAKKPVVAVCGVRTGCGKSQTTRKVCEITQKFNYKVVVVRHPMPYGNLKDQVVQRFSAYEDFQKHQCTIEEREEYEPLVDRGIIVYAGIDYCRILQQAESEADLIVWDGGNNDTPFFRPDIHIVLFDPFRAGHELLYYPGETNMRMADIAVINKVNTAPPAKIAQVKHNIQKYADKAAIILAESDLVITNPERISGKKVLVVEDGPTLTHGGMEYGAGMLAAKQHGAAEIIDPRPYAVGTIKETFRNYSHIGSVLPAMGYSKEQIDDLEATINRVNCDLVVFATPIHLSRLLSVKQPTIRVRYEYRDHGGPYLENILSDRLRLKIAQKRIVRDASCKEPTP